MTQQSKNAIKRLLQELYEKKRYWYHVSTTLKKPLEFLKPRSNDEGFNRSEGEPDIKRICVSPTLSQCLIAIPYRKQNILYIYRTEKQVIAKKSSGVFDSPVTMEGWLTKPTWFVRMGTLDMEKITNSNGKLIKVPSEVASHGCLNFSKILYRWWVGHDPWKFVRKSRH